jgi:cellobiose-specific phosphotransferase system component IIB
LPPGTLYQTPAHSNTQHSPIYKPDAVCVTPQIKLASEKLKKKATHAAISTK